MPYRIKIVLMLCIASVLGVKAQVVLYNFSSEKEGYRGKIKTITTYFKESDTLRVTLAKDGINKKNIKSIKNYNAHGLLEKTWHIDNKGNSNVKYYKYNDRKQLVSIAMVKPEIPLITKDTFLYDTTGLICVHTLNENKYDRVSVNGKIENITKKIIYFDQHFRQYKIEYLDSTAKTLITSVFRYDTSLNIIECKIFEGKKIRERYYQEFDLNNRIKSTVFLDKNEDIVIKNNYTWINDDTLIFEATDAFGNIIMTYKETCLKDRVGNVIEKHYYNTIDNYFSVTIYKIDYF